MHYTLLKRDGYSASIKVRHSINSRLETEPAKMQCSGLIKKCVFKKKSLKGLTLVVSYCKAPNSGCPKR